MMDICSMPILSVFTGTWSDGFEHPDLGEWKIHRRSGNQPVWRTENGFLLAEHSGCSGAWIGDESWKNYSVETTVILLEELPRGSETPNSRGATVNMYWKVEPFQGYSCGIYRGRYDGGEAGLYLDVAKGWGPPTLSKHVPMKAEFDREYRIRITQEGELIKCYLDGTLMSELEMDARFTSGVPILGLMNARAHFDDFSVTGVSIPDGGPGILGG